jgi:Abnormal spindle-like microcephaly-assoc'd, ASPM-SPD-2-Hydin
MLQATMNGLKRWRLAGVLLAVLAPLALSPAVAGAQEAEDTPPVVTNVTASPNSLPAEGGLVTIFADATDENGGVTWVQAEITGPFGGPETVLMSFTGVGQTYSGSLTIPANFTDSQMDYSVVVQAIDLGGNSTWAEGGGISVAAAPQFDERPIVADPVVTPRDLPSGGGASTIRVTATDDRAISEVYATITRPDGSTTSVPLEGISSSQFEGVFAAPANTRPTAAQYAVEVTALDDIGQGASADAGLVTVAAVAPPPNPARITVSPGWLSFQKIRVGDRRRASIVVRNTGGRSASTVRGVVALSGAGFALVGAGPTGIAFTLRPGESKAIKVEFRPTSPGRYAGTVTVRRNDGAQPGLPVRLSGQATPKKRRGR